MAANAVPPLVARVAVARRAVAGGAVAGGAVAGRVAKLALVLTRRSVAAAANSPSAAVTGIPLLALQAGGGDPPDWVRDSFALQELVQLRQALDGEAAGK